MFRELSKTVLPILLILTCLSGLGYLGPRAAHAPSPSSPTNVIPNSSFEGGLYVETVSSVPTLVPDNWSFETCEGVPNAAVSLDQNLWTDRLNSTRVSTGLLASVGCFPGNFTDRRVGFSQYRTPQGQTLGQGYNFTSLTDDPYGFSFWFRLQPYDSNGMAGFEIRLFGAESQAELDYFINPDPSIGSFSNSSQVYSLGFTGYNFGEWYLFHRNLKADWANAGLSLHWNFTDVQFQGFATRSGSVYKSETFWLDDVRVYEGQGTLP